MCIKPDDLCRTTTEELFNRVGSNPWPVLDLSGRFEWSVVACIDKHRHLTSIRSLISVTVQ